MSHQKRPSQRLAPNNCITLPGTFLGSQSVSVAPKGVCRPNQLCVSPTNWLSVCLIARSFYRLSVASTDYPSLLTTVCGCDCLSLSDCHSYPPAIGSEIIFVNLVVCLWLQLMVRSSQQTSVNPSCCCFSFSLPPSVPTPKHCLSLK